MRLRERQENCQTSREASVAKGGAESADPAAPCCSTLRSARLLVPAFRLAYSVLGGQMAEEVLCVQCDSPEWQCQCDKYCSMCKSWENVFLCTDGQYYCANCREAMDLKIANPGKS
jgi:hypothetical protein